MSGKHADAVRKALDAWIEHDDDYRALADAVQDAQAELRRAVTDDAWALYLVLEERVNARHWEIVTAAIELATRGTPKPER